MLCALFVVLQAGHMASAMQSGFGRKKDVIPSIKTDVKYIRCQVCELVAKEAFTAVARMRQSQPSWKQLSEDDILGHLEALCDPQREEGTWTLKLDVKEEGEKLNVVEMGNVRAPGRSLPILR